MIMAKEYYSLKNMLEVEADYSILLGEKSNGKSYAVKKFCIEDYWKNGNEFVYMRRYQFDVKTADVMAYFADAPVAEITKGKYTCINVYQGSIYLANHDDETNKYANGPKIGRAVYLSGYHHYASQAFPGVQNIIFEEFITDSLYLDNEPDTLQRFVSTILRDRNGRVFLCGNTINRVCPYFSHWSLRNVLKQAQGTIDVYSFERELADEGTAITKIAVELCKSSNTPSRMFFGKTANFITGGKWDSHEHPKLPRPKEEYVLLYELLFEDGEFHFVLQLLVNEDGGMIVYVYPFTGTRRFLRKITSSFSDDPFITSKFNPEIYAEELMLKLIRESKVCFSDNLTGTDFEMVLKNRKGGL